MDVTPANSRELLQAEAAWRLAGALERVPGVAQELAELDASRPARSHGAAPLRFASIAVGVASMLACVAWFVLKAPMYQTARGEQRMLTLDDGSVVALNTGTQLTIRFTSHSREVLLEHGEALFQVAHDANRPFVVRAANGYAKALGTRFNVLAEEGRVTVSVLEGRVEVGPSEPARVLLQAGQSAAYAPSGQLVKPEMMQASPERITAWREGKLRFESWKLERAVKEYNRYAKKPVLLDVNSAGDIAISGVFRIGDSASFVAALAELVDAEVIDEGDELVVRTRP
jgi:transmembrane sensor